MMMSSYDERSPLLVDVKDALNDFKAAGPNCSGSVISYHNITYTVKTKVQGKKVDKEIIKDASGLMRPGLNAILGPTGSGKTTLLDILAGRKDRHNLSGLVLIDGHTQPLNFKCVSGYVVQEDVVMGTLTVRENLNFSASLRLPRSLGRTEREQRVQTIIEDLGLTEVADSKVGTVFIRGISGGERKRTNIGMELITSPQVLFLDEPTTGLDASTARTVIQLLHDLGSKGKTIILSIHQPRYSIFKLFHNMTLLSAGELVYQGAASDALGYFERIGYNCEEHNNPADFFLDVIIDAEASRRGGPKDVLPSNGHGGAKTNLSVMYRVSSLAAAVDRQIQPIMQEFINNRNTVGYSPGKEVTYATSFFRQLLIVSVRAVKNIFRNPQTSIVQLLVMLMFGAVVGAIYYDLGKGPNGLQNRVGAFFFIVMNMVFGNMSAVELFIHEKPIFIHESAGGYYRVSAYFLAKVICDLLPMRLFPIVGFSAIVYFMAGLQTDLIKFLIFTLTLLLTSLCACGLAFFVSASVQTFAIANLLIALPYVFMMVFSGVLLNVGSVGKWLSWIKYISIFRYGIEALDINELGGMSFDCQNTTAYCPTGDDYLKLQGIGKDDLWFKEIALASMTAILMLLAYVALRVIRKEK